MSKSLQTTIRELEDLFEVFNAKYFESELSKPVITVSPDMTKGAYGWCTAYKAWKTVNGNDGGYYEINICAEHLSRPFEDVAGTMLHEMIHLYNLENGVKDTSRGGTYHNKKFKTAAEAHGLTVECDPKYGWTVTQLTEEAREEVAGYMEFIGKSSFDLFRESVKKEPKGGKKSSSRKYVCPCCGLIVRATKEVKVKCFDCDELLIEEA
jgi:rubrerythrin